MIKERIVRFTGKDFLAVMRHANLSVSYHVHETLKDSDAALIDDKLFVSPNVLACLNDIDTFEETMNNLMIVRLPKTNIKPVY